MLQTNSLNEDRNAFYSQYSLKELEVQLTAEKSYINRNIIRQVIRKKRKDLTESSNQEVDFKDENTREIENLKESLKKTTDYFEQCQIRSTILQLQKNRHRSNSQSKITESPAIQNASQSVTRARSVINKSPSKKSPDNKEYKELIHDEMSTTTIETAILMTGDSVRLVWIMPFKILSSIECSWTFNEQNISVSHGVDRAVTKFDGKQSTLILSNVNKNDSGIYKVVVHSQRLKRNRLKFQIAINVGSEDKLNSFIVREESEVNTEKVVVNKPLPPTIGANPQTSSPKSETIYKPVVGLNKNRFNRHKTMIGQEMIGCINSIGNHKSTPTNPIKEEIKSPISNAVPCAMKRFTRSATSAKDIILMFCKLNTDEYYQYGVCVENLSTSWTDGLAFCALIHNFHPEAFDFSKLNKLNRRANFELAFSSADKYAEICPLLDVDDMMVMERPDWKCIFTYVQCFYKAFRTHPKNKLKTSPI